jgi:subtilisin family serine protease
MLLVVGALTVSTVAPLGATNLAQDDARSYIIVMAADPVVAYDGGIASLAATRPPQGTKINPASEHVRHYRAYLASQHDASLAEAGVDPNQKVNDYSIALNGYSAILSEAQVAEIQAQKNVVVVMPDELQQPTTDSSPTFLGLNARGGAWQRGIVGSGIVVGVIDTGIWPEHPSFADDGSYPAPPTGPLPCEFGDTAHNPNDAPFTCNNKLIGAYQMLDTYRALIGADPDEFNSARDDSGHGTHTASTAAGNSGVAATVLGIPRGTVSGIAPRAHIIAYKGLGNLGGFTSDLVAAIDQAVADGVDVINYSIGGGASLTGGDDIAFLFAADAGVFVAASAGNSGPGAATIGGPGSVPWLTTVGASTQSRFFQGTVQLGNGSSYTGASITAGVGPAPLVDAEDAGDDLCNPGALDPDVVEGAIVLCRRGVIARVAKSQAVLEAGGVGMIMYENSDTGSLFSDSHWVPSVHVDLTPGLAIKAYIDAAGSAATATLVGEQLGTWPNAPTMTEFSSRGPNPAALDIIKPDITAPGIHILAGNSPFPDPGTVPGELLQAIAGTSMSSPHVAGLFALLKQAHPRWTPAMAKSALMTSSSQNVQDNDRVSQATPFEMGAGHANPGSPLSKGSSFQPGLVYNAGFLEYLGFLCEAGPEVFANPAATCASLAGQGIPTTAINLNLPSIGISQLAGSQTIRRTVTQDATENVTYNVSVAAPEGYTVSVSPNVLRLRRGQSATYEVTITNVSAPVGEWRFGSLTWMSNNNQYKVYSPIAVRAAEFDAPEELTASGEGGTASFDVQFGYTGDYTAGAHGLQSATLTNDNVLQDPDQTFDPGDVAAGGANAHTFDLTGAVFFRIAIPPEATEADADLDVYVFNPDGVQVASSTLGGTDEEVSITAPAPGVWTVYVHGWQAPGGDSDYTMYSWSLPAAAGGGSLVIDSAPSAATIGTAGTINVSWTGATLGEWHLGAVSHNGPNGLMGLTLLEVDNR